MVSGVAAGYVELFQLGLALQLCLATRFLVLLCGVLVVLKHIFVHEGLIVDKHVIIHEGLIADKHVFGQEGLIVHKHRVAG